MAETLVEKLDDLNIENLLDAFQVYKAGETRTITNPFLKVVLGIAQTLDFRSFERFKPFMRVLYNVSRAFRIQF